MGPKQAPKKFEIGPIGVGLGMMYQYLLRQCAVRTRTHDAQ